MYLHLFFVNSPIFNSEFVFFIKKNFDISKHRFVFAHYDSYVLAKDIHECEYSTSILSNIGVLKYIKNSKYKYVFIHSLNSKSLFLVPKRYYRKICWCSWGHDIPNIISQPTSWKSSIKRIIMNPKIQSIHSFIAGFKGDIDAFNEFDKKKHVKIFNAIYPMGYNVSTFPKDIVGPNSPLKIMIGHSAFPFLQHKKYLDILEPYSDKICIYLMLNYGDEAYSNEIERTVSKKFKNYQIIKDFIDKETYVNLLNEIDYFVFDFKKQAAFGNLLLLLYLRKNIYLAEDGVMYKTFINEHLRVKKCTSLVDDINNPQNSFNAEELSVNKEWAINYLDENKVIMQWKNVFQNI